MKGLLKSFITFILSIVMLASLFTYLTLRSASNVVNKNNIKKVVKTYDVVEILETQGENSGLDSIYADAKEYGISEETVDSVINSESFKGLLGEVLGGAIDYVIYDVEIDRDEFPEMLVEVVEENIDRIDEEADLNLTKQEKEELINVIEEHSDEISEELDITIDEDSSEELEVFKLLLSAKTREKIIVLASVAALLIFLLNKKEYLYLKKFSSILIFAAIQLFLFVLAISLFAKNALDYEEARLIINPFIENIKYNMVFVGIIPLVIGIALIFLRKHLIKNQPSV